MHPWHWTARNVHRWHGCDGNSEPRSLSLTLERWRMSNCVLTNGYMIRVQSLNLGVPPDNHPNLGQHDCSQWDLNVKLMKDVPHMRRSGNHYLSFPIEKMLEYTRIYIDHSDIMHCQLTRFETNGQPIPWHRKGARDGWWMADGDDRHPRDDPAQPEAIQVKIRLPCTFFPLTFLALGGRINARL